MRQSVINYVKENGIKLAANSKAFKSNYQISVV